MKTQRYLITAILVGTAAWNSPVARSVAAEQAAAEQSPDWQEAKEAFTPVNELRADSELSTDAANAGIAMRVLGVSNGEDLTVFPPVTGSVDSSATADSQQPRSVTEPQVVGMSFRPSGATEQWTTGQKSAQKAQSHLESELVLLPAVDSSIPSSTHLASSQSNGRLAYATRAFAAEEPVSSGNAPTEQFLQNSAPTQWGPAVVASGCCDAPCDSCCSNCCQSCCPPPIVVVGTEAVFVSPDINGVPVSYQFDDGPAAQSLFIGPAFDDGAMDDFYAAPRIWLGVQGPCWGIIGRYYHLRAGENAHDPLVPPGALADHSFDVNNILEAYYTDIELTRNFCLHGCKNQFTFGVRYANLEHHESIYGRSIVLTDEVDALIQGGARRNREAHGTGLTFGLNGRKPLFCNSCAHWFYNARGSVLWGPSSTQVETWADVTAANGTAVAGTIDTATALVDDDLFIAELQVGLEWDFALRCLPAKAFFRTAFEYQYWDASTGLTAAGSFAGVSGATEDFQVSTAADAPGLIVDFVGLSIGTGFTW